MAAIVKAPTSLYFDGGEKVYIYVSYMDTLEEKSRNTNVMSD